MHAAKAVQQRVIERLDAHGNSIDSAIAQQPGFVEGDGGGIALDGPFREAGPAQAPDGLQNAFPLSEGKPGGSAAAEKNGLRIQVGSRALQLAEQGPDIADDEWSGA